MIRPIWRLFLAVRLPVDVRALLTGDPVGNNNALLTYPFFRSTSSRSTARRPLQLAQRTYPACAARRAAHWWAEPTRSRSGMSGRNCTMPCWLPDTQATCRPHSTVRKPSSPGSAWCTNDYPVRFIQPVGQKWPAGSLRMVDAAKVNLNRTGMP